MQIKDMFEKKIDRDIKGVIKVGQSDEENVYQELDEYVVTKELLKHFRIALFRDAVFNSELEHIFLSVIVIQL